MSGRVAVALTIAGSDSSGGAGIQADLKTFAALGVYGASAITALTAQNTVGVQAITTVDPAFVISQIDSVLADLNVVSVKTGMLATAAIVHAVASRLARVPRRVRLPSKVCERVPEDSRTQQDSQPPRTTVDSVHLLTRRSR